MTNVNHRSDNKLRKLDQNQQNRETSGQFYYLHGWQLWTSCQPYVGCDQYLEQEPYSPNEIERNTWRIVRRIAIEHTGSFGILGQR